MSQLDSILTANFTDLYYDVRQEIYKHLSPRDQASLSRTQSLLFRQDRYPFSDICQGAKTLLESRNVAGFKQWIGRPSISMSVYSFCRKMNNTLHKTDEELTCNLHLLLLMHRSKFDLFKCPVSQNGNNLDIFKVVLRYKLYDFMIDSETFLLFVASAEMNDTEAFQLLVNRNITQKSPLRDMAFTAACSSGSLQVILLLLSDARFNPNSHYIFSIQEAYENHHYDVVKLLLEDGRADPTRASDESKMPLYLAIERGDTEFVEYFLSDYRVDPMANSGHALHLACSLGHLNVVQVLVRDPRLVHLKRRALYWSLSSGHPHLVWYFLKQSDVNFVPLLNAPSYYWNLPKGWFSAMQAVLDSLDSFENTYFSIVSAFSNRNLVQIESLLSEYHLLRHSLGKSQSENIQAIRKLLKIVYNDSKADIYFGLRFAILFNDMKMARILVHQEGHFHQREIKYAFLVACEKDYLEMVKLLMPLTEFSLQSAIGLGVAKRNHSFAVTHYLQNMLIWSHQEKYDNKLRNLK